MKVLLRGPVVGLMASLIVFLPLYFVELSVDALRVIFASAMMGLVALVYNLGYRVEELERTLREQKARRAVRPELHMDDVTAALRSQVLRDLEEQSRLMDVVRAKMGRRRP